jgi:hypothetical protein
MCIFPRLTSSEGSSGSATITETVASQPPARIESTVQLSIQSRSGGNGKQLVVLQDLKKGDLIYKIKKPVLAIVGSIAEFLQEVLINIGR